MIIFPAIDIKDGKVVRLLQGDFDKVTEYAHDPVEMAKHWQAKGAEWLHIVDLDGAQTGTMKNKALILKIAQTVSIPVETGGGIRQKQDIEDLLNGGIQRVVLSTKILQDPDFLEDLLKTYGSHVAVSLDCSNGIVMQKGWTESAGIKAVDLVKNLEAKGLRSLIYTDIATDGMLTGPNIKALEELLVHTAIPVIASGGVSSLEDIRKLKTLEDKGVIGAITGKAIYENKFDLKEAVDAARNG